MKRENLINSIRVKMDMTDIKNNNDDYYSESYNTLINECLSMIANSILPYQKSVTYVFGGYIDSSTVLTTLNRTKYYTLKDDINDIGRKGDWYYYDTSWHTEEKNSLGHTVKIPTDLLSFSDEARIKLVKPNGCIVMDADVYYLNPKELALPEDGSYTIWYNAEYPSIEDIGSNNLEDYIPTNVLKIIPSYVAAQCLQSEDLQKSIILKNEFETMLARLDDNKTLPSYSIKNKDGWTL